MIRINLLPEAKKREVGAGGSPQVWIIVYLLSAVAWCVLLAVIYWHFDGILQEKQAANAELKGEIERAEKQNANLTEIQQKLDKSKRLEDVVVRLQNARMGPTRVLMELSKVISREGGPTIDQQRLELIRRENPLAGYNPAWDFRRLWIQSFTENNRECKLNGVGKTNEDVAEFLRRLTLSQVFERVTLEGTSARNDKQSGLPVVTFNISCRVRY